MAGSGGVSGGPVVALPGGGGTGGNVSSDEGGSGGDTVEGYCGDGEKGSGEGCDDGNAKPGDGCSGTCKLEPGYVCETPGEPCVSTAKCGDGFLTNEACDDGNTMSGDGCSDTCEVEEKFRCDEPGKPCTPTQTSECGNGGVEFGETCDDKNDEPGDGCDASCRVEEGYRCPKPGEACVPEPKCGDGLRSPREQCDDGGVTPGDGCDATCHMEGPFWDCSKPGEPCESLVECGDGKALGEDEECDDGDTNDLNGCSNTCTLVPGWVCPPGGGACWARCGDGEVAGTEQCDDGGNVSNDGCSAFCQLELGYKCQGSPSVCSRTECGDGKTEGTEQCDDGDRFPFDGCSPTCTSEPGCVDSTTGARKACAAVCGDGLKFPTEACDDGNTRSGDGCSETCTIEPGYQCSTADIPNQIELPIVYRDFEPGAPPGSATTGHPDFQWGSEWFFNGAYWNRGAAANSINYPANASNQNDQGRTYNNVTVLSGPLTRLVQVGLGTSGALLGKPLFTATCPLSTTGAQNTSWLRRNDAYYCANTVKDATSFSQWFTDSALSTAVPSTLTLLRCPAPIPANHPVCTVASDADTFLFDSDTMLPSGCTKGSQNCDVDGFFPLDDQPDTKYADCNGSPNGRADMHNFHFTSEVRYWFQYDSGAAATLTFTGDDDVFVFVNGRLVVDLGGVHNRIQGSVTINGTTMDRSGAALNLTQGAIYEIAVFQAERNTCASNYRLQLKNFILGRSTCLPKCGDGVATPDEACDKGAENVASGDTYGKCTTSCELGPRCGDGVVQSAAGEACDNGLNNDTYLTSQYACAAGCKLPPSCGDGNVDTLAGELCDAGEDNSDEAYGPNLCSASCEPAPYCGDRAVDVDFGEGCDDGLNNGMPGSCTPDCKDSVPLPTCGDGEPDPNEQCDEGSNNGKQGSSCDAQCRLRCGNGFKDPGEECDDGTNDGSYGGCNPDCTPAAYCGDGETNGPEQCDAGDENGSEPQYGPEQCSETCRRAPYCGDGKIQVAFQEECDSTPGCDNECQNVIPR